MTKTPIGVLGIDLGKSSCSLAGMDATAARKMVFCSAELAIVGRPGGFLGPDRCQAGAVRPSSQTRRWKL